MLENTVSPGHLSVINGRKQTHKDRKHDHSLSGGHMSSGSRSISHRYPYSLAPGSPSLYQRFQGQEVLAMIDHVCSNKRDLVDSNPPQNIYKEPARLAGSRVV